MRHEEAVRARAGAVDYSWVSFVLTSLYFIVLDDLDDTLDGGVLKGMGTGKPIKYNSSEQVNYAKATNLSKQKKDEVSSLERLAVNLWRSYHIKVNDE